MTDNKKENSEEKEWGKHEFWGLGYSYDPQWTLSEELKDLQRKLIEVCRTKIRPKAVSALFITFSFISVSFSQHFNTERYTV